MPLSVEILTPTRMLVQDEADELNLPAAQATSVFFRATLLSSLISASVSSCFARTGSRAS